MTVATITNAIPSWLRKFVGYGVAAGIAMAIVVVAFLMIPTLRDFIQAKLGMPTVQNVNDVAAGVSAMSESELRSTIAFTAAEVVRLAMDSAAASQDTLFAQMDREVIRPGLNRLNLITRNVRELNLLMNVNNDILDAQGQRTDRTNSTIEELRDLVQGAQSAEERERLEDKMDLIIKQNEAIMKKQKIDRITM